MPVITKYFRKWGIFVLLLLSLPSGIYVWSLKDFPLPKISPRSNPFLHLQIQRYLVRKKIDFHTKHLKLKGSRWYDEETGAIADFGEDGVFRWIEPPKTKSPLLVAKSIELGLPLHGAGFELSSDEKTGFYFQNGGMRQSYRQVRGNLAFPGISDGGSISFNGRLLGLEARFGVEHFVIIFDRKIN